MHNTLMIHNVQRVVVRLHQHYNDKKVFTPESGWRDLEIYDADGNRVTITLHASNIARLRIEGNDVTDNGCQLPMPTDDLMEATA